MKENANSRRNMQVVGDMYARVMRALAEKEGKGESYPSLKEAPVERLPYLVEKFIQAARKSNMEVYASGTFHFIWNRVANILSSRETDPVNPVTSSQDQIWRFRLLYCWSTSHKSYCGGMWTWRTPQQC